ncbi:TonB family protein [Thalassomonas viridans]|uniref:TonB family protein n=1 Tax=Thalassomonas viridans TaxID=137584 RepID=A0AAE9Z506_9GAMM|nr:energy transducer TonB [Thalassomonas viridans]WDE05252.1 TonB family protein [Thalassomonas viridans]
MNKLEQGQGKTMKQDREDEVELAYEQKIQALYQQRKNQLQAPEIRLQGQGQEHPGRAYLAGVRPLMLLLGGGVVSFGLMALVSHFAGYQMHSQRLPEPEQKVIELVPEPRAVEKEAVIPLIPPLPPKVVPQAPETSPSLAAERHQQPDDSGVFHWQVNITQETVLPELKQPSVTLTPSYKVMPEYSVNARKKGQEGKVKLSYKINDAGQVTDIQVLDASVGRELQKLSRQALAKWRYRAGISSGQQQQVVFEFSLNDG